MDKQKKPVTLRRVLNIILISLLITGILISGASGTILALNLPSLEKTTAGSQQSGTSTAPSTDTDDTTAVFPADNFKHLKNEMALNDKVSVISEENSNKIADAVTKIEPYNTYDSKECFQITLTGDMKDLLKDISRDKIIYLNSDEDSAFGGDRIWQVESISIGEKESSLKVSEPYFEDVFDTVELNMSDLLTEDNLVSSYYANGVSAHFGDIEKELLSSSTFSEFEVTELGDGYRTENSEFIDTATDSSYKNGDLIVDIDFDFSKKSDDKNDKNKKNDKEKNDDKIDVSYGIKGQFGIKDLASHIVCDMPRTADFEELYFGVSGTTFAKINPYGSMEMSASEEGTERDFKLFTLGGLNKKKFPIAAFKFKGSTPVLISNRQFENAQEKVTPAIFVVIYSDWDGKISLELSGSIEYSNSFNNGLRVYDGGEVNLRFEKYPYNQGSTKEEDNLEWNIDLKLEAETDLTLLGASVLFHVAGVNLAEIGAARVGFEAECNLPMFSANSKDGVKLPNSSNTDLYLRMYLKLVEVNLRLKAQGKTFLEKLSVDLKFDYTLLDFTLFLLGNQTEKFASSTPVTSMKYPDEFDSVMTLVCDVSGSMSSTIDTGETKLEALKEAGKVITSTTKDWSQKYNSDYGIGIVKFSGSAENVAFPHIDYDFISACIDSLTSSGSTSIAAGIDTGVSQLENVVSNNKIMILMTDGQDYSDSKTKNSAKKAAEKGIKIYTIGFGSDVSENILKDVADITGGEYKYASTDSIIDIIGSFMYAHMATNSEVLADLSGTVREGELSDANSIVVPDGQGNLEVVTVWPGSFLDTLLTDPNGREVDENYPGAVIDESSIPSNITVSNPLPGEWSVRIKGVETSYEQEPFYLIAAFKETGENVVAADKIPVLDTLAGYGLPIGLFTVIMSTMLLICVNSKKKKRSSKSEC